MINKKSFTFFQPAKVRFFILKTVILTGSLTL